MMDRPIAFYPRLARELNDPLAAIYYQQLDYWQDKGNREDGWIYKTKEEIEEETTLTREQQDRIRKLLVTKGWLATKLFKVNGAPTLHYKTLVSVQILISVKDTNGLVSSTPIEKREFHVSSTKTTAKTTTEPIVPFQFFWDVYPKHTTKKESVAVWNRLNPSVELAQKMITSIGLHKQSRKWKEGFIKDPVRWLRNECWNDEIDLEKEKQVEEKKKVAYIDGDRAYQKDGKWMMILHDGRHVEYGGRNAPNVEWK